MNIDQYRALKAQEANKATQPLAVAPVVDKPIDKPIETTPVVEKPVVPEKIAIEGIGDVSIDELKNGYLRQSDYTQKTQEVARQRREVQDAVTLYEQLKTKPELITQVAQNVKVPPALDPTTAQVVELKNMVYDMMVEKEIMTLQQKYPDFEVSKVLPIAQAKNLTNLEDAYILSKGAAAAQPVNKADLEKQIREQLIREMEAEKSATQTIIGTHGNPAPITDNTPKLSPDEQKVAKMMFRGVADPFAEYAKWRDTDKRK